MRRRGGGATYTRNSPNSGRGMNSLAGSVNSALTVKSKSHASPGGVFVGWWGCWGGPPMCAHQTYTLIRLSTYNRGRNCVDTQWSACPITGNTKWHRQFPGNRLTTGSWVLVWNTRWRTPLCVIIRHALRPWPNKVQILVETPVRSPVWTTLPPESGHFHVHLLYGFGPFLYSQPALQTKKNHPWTRPGFLLVDAYIAPPDTYTSWNSLLYLGDWKKKKN